MNILRTLLTNNNAHLCSPQISFVSGRSSRLYTFSRTFSHKNQPLLRKICTTQRNLANNTQFSFINDKYFKKQIIIKRSYNTGGDSGAEEELNQLVQIIEKPQRYEELVRDAEYRQNHPELRDSDQYIERAGNFISQGKLNDALLDAHVAIELKPNSPTGYMARGAIYEEIGEYQRAIEDYRMVIGFDPSSLPTYAQIARCYSVLGYNEVALTWLDRILCVDKKFVPAIGARGDIYFNQRKYDLAKEDYVAVLKEEPGNLFALSGLGRIYMFSLDTLKAKEIYQRILRIDPGNVEAIVNLSVVEEEMGNEQAALELLNKAISRDGSPDLLHRRAAWYIARGNVEQAFADVNEALQIDPKHLQSCALRGHLCAHQNNLEGAIRDLGNYYTATVGRRQGIDPQHDNMMYLQLAECYADMYRVEHKMQKDPRVVVDMMSDSDIADIKNQTLSQLEEKATDIQYQLASITSKLTASKTRDKENLTNSIAVLMEALRLQDNDIGRRLFTCISRMVEHFMDSVKKKKSSKKEK